MGYTLSVADFAGAVQAVRTLARTRTPRVQVEQLEPGDPSPAVRILGVYFRDAEEWTAYQQRLAGPGPIAASQLEWVTRRVHPSAGEAVEAIARSFDIAGYHGEMVT